MRVLNVPMDDPEFERLAKAKELAEQRAGRSLSWREFFLSLVD